MTCTGFCNHRDHTVATRFENLQELSTCSQIKPKFHCLTSKALQSLVLLYLFNCIFLRLPLSTLWTISKLRLVLILCTFLCLSTHTLSHIILPSFPFPVILSTFDLSLRLRLGPLLSRKCFLNRFDHLLFWNAARPTSFIIN